MNYTVDVTREGDAWLARVTDLPGAHTFARNLVALQSAVREVVALVLDIPDGTPLPALDYVYREVPEEFLEAIRVKDQRRATEEQQRAVAADTLRAAAALVDSGFSVRDISVALGITPGRVTQLLPGRDRSAIGRRG